MWVRRVVAGVLAGLAMLGATAVGAQADPGMHPIPIHMRPGSDKVRLVGVLRQNSDCCAYVFKAHAGQTLHWKLTGPIVRIVMTYPDGHSDGPGVPKDVPLPTDGAYVFRVSGDTMADHAFGRFVLTLRIPPR